MTKRIAPVLTVLASLAVPTNAPARHRAPRARIPNPIELAQARAAESWGEAPCNRRVRVAVERPSAGLIEGLRRLYGPAGEYPLSWAEWQSPSGAGSKVSPPDTYTDCRVVLNSAFWPSLAYDRAHFVDLCTAITHEYGNLWGLPEIEGDPENVMNRSEPEAPGVCLI